MSAPLTADWRYRFEHESGAKLSDSDVNPQSELETPIDSYVDDVLCRPELRAKITCWPEDIECSLDRLTIAGRVKGTAIKRLQRWLDTCPYVGPALPSQLPYRWGHVLADTRGFIQYGDARQGAIAGSGAAIRYDFNPRHVSISQAQEILRHITDDRHVTRVDIAVDYPEDLSRVRWDRARCSRTVYTGTDGSTETVYLGAPGSKLRIRCYDKAREREYAGQYTPPGVSWWRTEAVWRPARGDDLLPSGLFSSLQALNEGKTLSGHWRDYGAILYARDHPEWVRGLHWRQRKLVKEALEGCFPPLDPHPSEVFDQHFESLRLLILQYAFNLTEVDTDLEHSENPRS